MVSLMVAFARDLWKRVRSLSSKTVSEKTQESIKSPQFSKNLQSSSQDRLPTQGLEIYLEISE